MREKKPPRPFAVIKEEVVPLLVKQKEQGLSDQEMNILRGLGVELMRLERDEVRPLYESAFLALRAEAASRERRVRDRYSSLLEKIFKGEELTEQEKKDFAACANLLSAEH